MTVSRLTLRRILARERAWAEGRGIELEAFDRVRDWRDNLLHPLSSEQERELSTNPLQPLGEAGKPAELARLQSALAIVCNCIGPWSVQGREMVGRALGAASDPASIEFAAVLSEAPATGAELVVADAMLSAIGSSRPTAVVTSYTEPYDQPETRAVASEVAVSETLPGCALLAADHRSHPKRFGSLCVARLLSCAWSLTLAHGERGFRLAYIWYDAGDATAHRHRREIDRFRMRVGGEIDFHATTWQHVLASLSELETDRGDLVRALTDRYLGR